LGPLERADPGEPETYYIKLQLRKGKVEGRNMKICSKNFDKACIGVELCGMPNPILGGPTT
jgi:hypothetical protein